MKLFKTTLKEPITVLVDFDVDYKDILEANRLVEAIKHRSFLQIKQSMHERIDTLSIDDLKFEITNVKRFQ